MAKFSPKSKLPTDEREELLINFFESLASVRSSKEAAQVFSDLLSRQELDMVAKRLAIAKDLLEEKSYQEIMKDLKVGSGTVARVNTWLNVAGEGDRLVAKRGGRRQGAFGRDSVWASEENMPGFKRKYPTYFWPEHLLEQIVRSSNRKQKDQLRAVIRQSKHKTRLLKQLSKLIKPTNT